MAEVAYQPQFVPDFIEENIAPQGELTGLIGVL
jgi:hypothetical protein